MGKEAADERTNRCHDLWKTVPGWPGKQKEVVSTFHISNINIT